MEFSSYDTKTNLDSPPKVLVIATENFIFMQ